VHILDACLSDRTFLADELFSIGDIPAATTVHRWYALDIHHPELPNLYGWYQFMKERQSFRAIMTPLSSLSGLLLKSTIDAVFSVD
jgi:glutathione S-transferase